MKKIYMTMVAMLCGVAAMAQTGENVLYAEDINIKPGDEFQIAVCLKNADPVTSIAFQINNLPQGITIADYDADYSFNEERIDLDWVRTLQNRPNWPASRFYTFSVTADGSESNSIVFGPTQAASGRMGDNGWEGTSFLGNDGELVYVPVYVAADTPKEVYTITISNISIANNEYKPVSVATASEATFKINVGETTGISSVKADSKAPIYNIAGQRVSKAQKGVFIQGGKKVAVK